MLIPNIKDVIVEKQITKWKLETKQIWDGWEYQNWSYIACQKAKKMGSEYTPVFSYDKLNHCIVCIVKHNGIKKTLWNPGRNEMMFEEAVDNKIKIVENMHYNIGYGKLKLEERTENDRMEM